MCEVDGCDRAHCARGLCRRHYSQYWDHANRNKRRSYDNERYRRDRAAYYAENRGRIRARQAEWREANADDYNARRRAFLCDPCNVGLGRFKDDPEVLRAAVRWVA
ncbi:MAG: endonuclease domain-containing protein [Solirubrobacteraceae bacterium]